MSRVEKTVEVNVPIRVAYDQWTQFEEFPRFMEGVKSVRQLDDTHLRWTAEIAGQEVEWDARIMTQRPDDMISWSSTSGARNAGVVRFVRTADEATRITLAMDVDPQGAVQQAGDALGILDRQVERPGALQDVHRVPRRTHRCVARNGGGPLPALIGWVLGPSPEPAARADILAARGHRSARRRLLPAASSAEHEWLRHTPTTAA
jgi:carbon monoxide dehydrogenase subunit G